MENKLKLIVRRRDGIEFEGEVFAVSGVNDIGPFDILNNHANFVANIKEKITIHKDKNKKSEIQITTGIISAKENLVEIFLGI